jgi:undecaprenyl-diphosphatase
LAIRTRTLYLIAAAAVLFSIWLGRAATLGRTLPFDGAIRDAIHACASPSLTLVMLGITQMGEPLFLVLVTLLAAWRLSIAGRRRAAALLGLSTIGVTALSESLKVVFHRTRPPGFFGYAEPLTYSFPSGHAITSICFYGVLSLILSSATRSAARRRVLWITTVLLILLIGFSRIYLGVHYPTDVLGGYVLGIAWLIGVLHAAPAIAGKWFRPS